MKGILKTICLSLAIVLIITLIGCKKDNNSSTISSSSEPYVSSSEASSSTDSSEEEYVYQGSYDDFFSNKDPFSVGETTEPTPPKRPTNNLVVTNKSWSGPSGYVIVVPAGNTKAKETAEALKNHFIKANGVTLKIAEDTTAETKKEILIGKTNRSESNKNLADSKIKVSVVGEKLVFDGGHDVTVDMAVQNFMLLTSGSREVPTFEEKTDFSSTKNSVYEYVWGDEFYGNSLNKNSIMMKPYKKH